MFSIKAEIRLPGYGGTPATHLSALQEVSLTLHPQERARGPDRTFSKASEEASRSVNIEFFPPPSPSFCHCLADNVAGWWVSSGLGA